MLAITQYNNKVSKQNIIEMSLSDMESVELTPVRNTPEVPVSDINDSPVNEPLSHVWELLQEKQEQMQQEETNQETEQEEIKEGFKEEIQEDQTKEEAEEEPTVRGGDFPTPAQNLACVPEIDYNAIMKELMDKVELDDKNTEWVEVSEEPLFFIDPNGVNPMFTSNAGEEIQNIEDEGEESIEEESVEEAMAACGVNEPLPAGPGTKGVPRITSKDVTSVRTSGPFGNPSVVKRTPTEAKKSQSVRSVPPKNKNKPNPGQEEGTPENPVFHSENIWDDESDTKPNRSKASVSKSSKNSKVSSKKKDHKSKKVDDSSDDSSSDEDLKSLIKQAKSKKSRGDKRVIIVNHNHYY